MASSRPIRKASRKASPMDPAKKSSLPAEEDSKVLRERSTSIGVWQEPPLRPPAPSFEDQKGLERTGVLENMLPLGAMPNQKVKSRVKTHELTRRSFIAKNGEKDDVTPTPPPPVTRRSEPRRLEDRPTKLHSSRERDEDQDYLPKGASRTTPVKATALQPAIHGTPTSRTTAGQARLRQVVESAVERSNELQTPFLGQAIKKLFEESLHNRTLAELLDAVLSRKPTARQAADFQGYIKVAKKQIKAEAAAQRAVAATDVGKASQPATKSPSKSGRPSVAHPAGSAKDFSDATSANEYEMSGALKRTRNMEGNGIAAKSERPAKRRKRSHSASSLSSLSSLSSSEQNFPPAEGSEQADSAKVDASTQPITTAPAEPLLGPKLHTFSTSKPSSPSNKRPAATAEGTFDEPSEEVAPKRRKLQTFDDYTVIDSDIRVAPVPRTQTQFPSSSSSVPTLPNLRTQQPRLRNGTSQRSRRDDYDDLQSPGSSAQSELLIPPPSSRGATPVHHVGRPAKQVKRAARIKMSPMKKNTVAGMPDSTVRKADGHKVDTNADKCAACSGQGKLLCCDGCVHSFHFSCFDPPIDPENPPEGEWFCVKCKASREPRRASRSGLMSSLINDVEARNPSAYRLPSEVRDHFEGVKTGEEGEYEEVHQVKSTRTRAGLEEGSTITKVKDDLVMCHGCMQAAGDREIIPCDFCSLHWHLDCLFPPLANAPRRTKAPWQCPCHVDEILNDLRGPSTVAGNKQPVTNRRYRVRRPKHPLIRDVSMRRGFMNNGLIEILNESDPDESDVERESAGVIYRIPEHGIKLDFINRVKRANAEEAALQKQLEPRKQARDARKLRAEAKRVQRAADERQEDAFENRPFLERQAALNLARFAQSNRDLGLGANQVGDLIDTLIAEAPANVAALFADESGSKGKGREGAGSSSGSAAPAQSVLPDEERKFLESLQELIRRRLAGSNDA